MAAKFQRVAKGGSFMIDQILATDETRIKHGNHGKRRATDERRLFLSASVLDPCFIRGYSCCHHSLLTSRHWPIYEIRPHRPKIGVTFIMCVFHVFVTGEFLCRQKLCPTRKPAKRPGRNSP